MCFAGGLIESHLSMFYTLYTHTHIYIYIYIYIYIFFLKQLKVDTFLGGNGGWDPQGISKPTTFTLQSTDQSVALCASHLSDVPATEWHWYICPFHQHPLHYKPSGDATESEWNRDRSLNLHCPADSCMISKINKHRTSQSGAINDGMQDREHLDWKKWLLGITPQMWWMWSQLAFVHLSPNKSYYVISLVYY